MASLPTQRDAIGNPHPPENDRGLPAQAEIEPHVIAGADLNTKVHFVVSAATQQLATELHGCSTFVAARRLSDNMQVASGIYAIEDLNRTPCMFEGYHAVRFTIKPDNTSKIRLAQTGDYRLLFLIGKPSETDDTKSDVIRWFWSNRFTVGLTNGVSPSA